MYMGESIDNQTEASTPEYMLTTVDNPYSPFTQFREWLVWDNAHGYNTGGLLARIAITSSELSDADQAVARNNAIEEIINENVFGVHRRVTRNWYQV